MMSIIVLSILLSISLYLNHGHHLYRLLIILYRKLIKPKFKVGEFVLIKDVEYRITLICDNQKPYTYFCLPVITKHGSMLYSSRYFHESEIRKKQGILKALE